jgi:hypothetical protein
MRYEVGQRLRTRSGFPARILCTNLANEKFNIVAAVKMHGNEVIYYYNSEEKEMKTSLDLVSNYIDYTREMDACIGNLLNGTTLTIEECKKRFLEKYPNHEGYFNEFIGDYFS